MFLTLLAPLQFSEDTPAVSCWSDIKKQEKALNNCHLCLLFHSPVEPGQDPRCLQPHHADRNQHLSHWCRPVLSLQPCSSYWKTSPLLVKQWKTSIGAMTSTHNTRRSPPQPPSWSFPSCYGATWCVHTCPLPAWCWRLTVKPPSPELPRLGLPCTWKKLFQEFIFKSHWQHASSRCYMVCFCWLRNNCCLRVARCLK